MNTYLLPNDKITIHKANKIPRYHLDPQNNMCFTYKLLIIYNKFPQKAGTKSEHLFTN